MRGLFFYEVLEDFMFYNRKKGNNVDKEVIEKPEYQKASILKGHKRKLNV